MTSIYKLKKSEYKEGARLTFQNYEDLIVVAEKAAQIKNYGTASSLCVLAIEELAKSVILELKAINNSIPIKSLEKYFTCHITKQKAGIDIFCSIVATFESIEDKNNKSKPNDTDLAIVIGIIALIIAFIVNNKDNFNIDEKKSLFDKIKETGFYVGYNESERKWINPRNEHNKESFESILYLTNEFSGKVKNWIFNDNLNQKNILSFLDSLDSSLIDKSNLNKLFK